MSVIVTSGCNRIGYAVVRGLAEAGVDVAIGDTHTLSMAGCSRSISRRFVYPDPATDLEGFTACLADHARAGDVIMPVYGEALAVARVRDSLSRQAYVASPSYEQMVAVSAKDCMQVLAGSLGIPTPPTVIPAVGSSVSSACVGLRRPVLLKPPAGKGSEGLTRVAANADLDAVYHASCRRSGCAQLMVQELIGGDEYGVAMLFDYGRLVARFCFRVLTTFSATSGTATLRESIRAPDIEAMLQKLLEHLEWHGVCQADFIREHTSGRWYLLDVNPRFWGSLYCAIAAGVNFPLLLYKIARGEPVAPVLDYRLGVRTRWLWGDLRRLAGCLLRPSACQAAVHTAGGLWPSAHAYDDLCPDDPLPFVVAPLAPLAGAFRDWVASRRDRKASELCPRWPR